MEFERKYLAEAPSTDDEGVISGYASRFGITDQGGDIVAKGAFTQCLLHDRRIHMLWQHDQAQPIGVWSSIKEDEIGLKVEGRLLLETQKGREIHAMLKAGILDSLSIGYRVKRASKDQSGYRHLKEIDLWEISIVTFPMLPQAKISDVKSERENVALLKRNVERFVRDAGYSAKEAKCAAIAAANALNCERDAIDADIIRNFVNEIIT